MTRYPKLHKAIRLAAKLHKHQDRDGQDPLPYISHPFEVMSNLRYLGGITDEDLLCAAMLHDTIEECGVEPKLIEEELGARVSSLVEGLTRKEPSQEVASSLSKDELWELRNRMLLSDIASMNPDEMTVKLADRLSNLRQALATRRGKKLQRYVLQSEEILKIIPESVNPPLWRTIRKTLDEYSS
jgi:guanosine-3',5'-bis(diphosphate) 3'-pyrophosphohydrolase